MKYIPYLLFVAAYLYYAQGPFFDHSSAPKRNLASSEQDLSAKIFKLDNLEIKLQDGIILEKKSEATEWHLYRGHGFPVDPKTNKPFPLVSKIHDLWQDGDAMLARDTNGKIYSYESRPTLVHEKEEIYTWSDVWGIPVTKALVLPIDQYPSHHVSFARRTRSNSGYVTDGAGNLHAAGGVSSLIINKNHPTGNSGLIHIYALNRDGSRLNFADTGLPSGAGYTFDLPQNGQIRGESLSASGSVVMLLSTDGHIYTKFLDFDFSGHNPMMFDYTYDKKSVKKSQELQNYGTVVLPTKDWKKHPIVPIGEGGVITNEIVIETKGHGNDQKILKIFGKNNLGECGFFHKMINDENWQFEITDYCSLQKTVEVKSETLYPTNASNYTMPVALEDDSWIFEIENYRLEGNVFNIRLISPSGKTITGKLHQEFTWTPFEIVDPGYDGRAKLFHGTLELDNKNTSNVILNNLNLKTFGLYIAATDSWISIFSKDKKLYTESASDYKHSYIKSLERKTDLACSFIQCHNRSKMKKIIHQEHLKLVLDEHKKASMYVTASYPIEGLAVVTTVKFWGFPIGAIAPPKRILDVGLDIIRTRKKLLDREVKMLQTFD